MTKRFSKSVNMKWSVFKRLLVWGLIIELVLSPFPGFADVYVRGQGLFSGAKAPGLKQLPVPLNIDPSMAVLEQASDAHLVVHQQQDKAILEWSSFDIGEEAWTQFDQKGRADWSVLNRIYDKNPSLIFGKLTADGQVFLINQNGMLFGPNSKVNTSHLVASALNIRDDNFKQGILNFESHDYIADPELSAAAAADADTEGPDTASVVNSGQISVNDNGTVYLLAPEVENRGLIEAPGGHVAMVAAKGAAMAYQDEVLSKTEQDTKRTIYGPSDSDGTYAGAPKDPGTATNSEQGTIRTDAGRAEMFGKVVNQEGLIRAVSTVQNRGEIWLTGTAKVATGATSQTLCPISDSSETVNRSSSPDTQYSAVHSEIKIEAPFIEHQGSIVAPSGSVALTAGKPEADLAFGDDGAVAEDYGPLGHRRIYLGPASVIDVSGESVELPAQSRVASMQLNSVQLRDDYGQKGGILKGNTIAFDTRRGTLIGNGSEAIATQLVTARQLNLNGGTIALTAHGTGGDILQTSGARLAFNGGQTQYAAGMVETTRVASGRRSYDISEAPQWLTYDRVLGNYEKRYDRFGIVEKYSGPYRNGGTVLKGRYSPAYVEGADAGTLNLTAQRVVLEGLLEGRAVVGAYQTASSETKAVNGSYITLGLARPSGGKLVLGRVSAGGINEDLNLNEALVTEATSTILGADFNPSDLLPSAYDALAAMNGAENMTRIYNPDASLISADLLSRSGLENVKIYANVRVATEAAAEISLPVGSRFTAYSRSIEHQGAIDAPAGNVELGTLINVTTPLDDVYPADQPPEGILLGAESVISVAGVRTHHLSMAAEGIPLHPTQSSGGGIHILEKGRLEAERTENGVTRDAVRLTKGLIMAEGSLLDVSGGYTISAGGNLSAGDAGTLELSSNTLILEGCLAGRSLPQAEGGELILTAGAIDIGATAAPHVVLDGGWNLIGDEERIGKLFLGAGELALTGFSTLDFSSRNQIEIQEHVSLSPSYAKAVYPEGVGTGAILAGYFRQEAFRQARSERVLFPPAGMASGGTISLAAGKNLFAPSGFVGSDPIFIHKNSQVFVAPGGSITFEAPVVEVAGQVQALGGTIEVASSADEGGTVHLYSGALLDVSGTLVPIKSGAVQGPYTEWKAMDAGTVSLQAVNGGSITVEADAQIDLSGSSAADFHYLRNGLSILKGQEAGSPGLLDLAFGGGLSIAGEIRTERFMEGLRGASLSIYRTNLDKALSVNGVDGLGLQATDDSGFIHIGSRRTGGGVAYGFDTLSLTSNTAIQFNGGLEMRLARSLTLDAPTIEAVEKGEAPPLVALMSPWIRVTNVYDESLDGSANVTAFGEPAEGAARLVLTASDLNGQGIGRLDVQGNVRLSGFAETHLHSSGDLVLSDNEFNGSATGLLTVAGDLYLSADQVYPATAADFTISALSISEDRKRKIEITRYDDNSATNGVVYSAGGSLVLDADQIRNYGTLLAPSGEIGIGRRDANGVLGQADLVYLAPGSLISTKGEYRVSYGNLEDPATESSWQLIKDDSTIEAVTDAPEKQVSLNAQAIVQQSGAVIDASGGGSIFAYGWMAATAGSLNPLEKSGRNIIVPGAVGIGAAENPGEAIYITGGSGLAEGLYTILPEAYAFLPGAMILEERGASKLAGALSSTIEGFRTVQGYRTYLGTGVKSDRLMDYAVRPAREVRDQGYYTIASHSTGVGGNVRIDGYTTILGGTILGSGSDDQPGGALELSGRTITLQETALLQSQTFDPDLEISAQPAFAGYMGTLSLATADMADNGFKTMRIGRVSYDASGEYTTGSTQSINVASGSRLVAQNLELNAIEAITIEGAADGEEATGLNASGDQGSLTLVCTGRKEGDAILGGVVLEDGAALEANTKIVLDAYDLSLDGTLNVLNSTIVLRSNGITFSNAARQPETQGSVTDTGLVITPDLWSKISTNETIELVSRGDVRFDPLRYPDGEAAVNWRTDGLLRIDTSGLVNLAEHNADITLSARQIQLFNTAVGSSESTAGAGGGLLQLQAQRIDIGHGDLRIDGFNTIKMTATRGDAMSTPADITFLGKGSLATNADLSLAADAVRTDLYRWIDDEGTEKFEATNYDVIATGRQISIDPSGGGLRLDREDLPGTLAMAAEGITISGAVSMTAGQLDLTAGNSGITLANGSEIYLAGNDNYSGGTLSMTVQGSGGVRLENGAVVNLDAGKQGDAGALNIYLDGGIVDPFLGTLQAHGGSGGAGGRFSLEAQSLGNLDTLLSSIQGAGFNKEIVVSSHSGNLTLGVDVSAEHIKLSAGYDNPLNTDSSLNGGLAINDAKLNAQGGEDGGLIELYARNNLTIGPDAELGADAASTAGRGGRIYVASANGVVTQNGTLSVSGGAQGQGGTVHFRALRNDDSAVVNMRIAGIIKGASRVDAEAVRIYGDDALADADGDSMLEVTAASVDSAIGHAADFLADPDLAWSPQALDQNGALLPIALSPGMEFQSTGDLEITGTEISLGSRRFSSNTVAGTLTLRAQGNLTIETRLTDIPVTAASNAEDQTGGWDLLLVAGADLTAADRFSVQSPASGGTLTFNKLSGRDATAGVCTYAGNMGFASAGDTQFVNYLSSDSMIQSQLGISNSESLGLYYSAASYGGSLIGLVQGKLALNGGILQTADGTIDLIVGKALDLGTEGAIRASGVPGEVDGTKDARSVWNYTAGNGTAIKIRAGESIGGSGILGSSPANTSSWDIYYPDSANNAHYAAVYGKDATRGIAAMAGGDVIVHAGGDIACQIGTFRQGDLKVSSGGELTGRYLVRQGLGELIAAGNIGENASTAFELGAAKFKAVAQGSAEIDTIVNATLLAPPAQSDWEKALTYGRDSSVEISALEGDISLFGRNGYYAGSSNYKLVSWLLPPIVGLHAGGDIRLGGRAQRDIGTNATATTPEFVLMPSAAGRLQLSAGGSIKGYSGNTQLMSGICMLDLSPAETDPLYDGSSNAGDAQQLVTSRGSSTVRYSLLHQDNPDPVIIAAGENIETIRFTLPTQALIGAKQDILDLVYQGQHLKEGDFSLIYAGRDIVQGSSSQFIETVDGNIYHKSRIEQGGPGTLLVQSGRYLHLGVSYGITAVGNKYNAALALGDQAVRLAVVSGYNLFEKIAANTVLRDPVGLENAAAGLYEDVPDLIAGLTGIFDQIRDAGRTYSEMLAEERKDEAEAFVANFRRRLLYPYFPQPAHGADENYGDIDMLNSKIKTVDSTKGIFIITAGDLNVGRSTLPDPTKATRESGIFTEYGGSINVYSGGYRHIDSEGNEKVAGHINVNESRVMTFMGGDITMWADKGDINAGRGSKGSLILPEPDVVDHQLRYKPPAQGSGVRTESFDPDGETGVKKAPKKGDGYIFAPDGEIDAGEAGISVDSAFLAATKYANVQNIEVSGVSVGVPVISDVGAGVGALAGTGSNLSEALSQSQESLAGDARERMQQTLQQINENLVKILNVEVVGFGGDQPASPEGDQEKSTTDDSKDK